MWEFSLRIVETFSFARLHAVCAVDPRVTEATRIQTDVAVADKCDAPLPADNWNMGRSQLLGQHRSQQVKVDLHEGVLSFPCSSNLVRRDSAGNLVALLIVSVCVAVLGFFGL